MNKNVKKIVLVFGLILAMVIVVFAKNNFYKGTSATASSLYLPKDNPLGSGVRNVYLINVSDNDASTDKGYLNTITYVGSDGVPTADVFMDTFIILGSTLHNRINIIKSLNSRVEEINAINNSNIKINIIMSIDAVTNNSSANENIDSQITNFISAFEDANVSNLKLIGFYWLPESINAVNSTFDMIEHFNSYVHGLNEGYKTLWIPYIMGYDRLHNGDNMITTSDLKTACDKYSAGINDEACNSGAEYTTINGIKFYRDELQMYGYKYGFDFVSLQSGYEFHGNNPSWNKYRSGSETTEVDRLALTDYQVLKMKSSVEVELDPDSSSNGSYYGYNGCTRYKEWLTYGLQKKWYNSVNTYYLFQQFSSFYLEHGGLARSFYDATYKYAKGTLTQADIDNISCDRGYYSNYENVSKGKSYDTNAKKYTAAPDDGKSYGYNVVNADANSFWKEDSSRYCKYGSFNGNKWKSSLYCDDGIKLTDGEYGKTSFSKYDEWVSYSVSGDTKPYNVIIDLGSNKTSLTYFGMELNNHNEGGLKIFPRDAAGSIKAYISSDRQNYSLLGELTLMENRNIFEAAYYELKLNNSVSGRYVKFEINYEGTGGFIFVSEAIVGKTSTISLDSNVSNMYLGDNSKQIALTIDNVVQNNLQVNNSDSSVASVTLSNNVLTVTPLKVGKTTITIIDSKYGTKAVHEVNVLKKAERYKVTFNANGGVLNGTDYVYVERGQSSIYANGDGNTLGSIPIVSKEGYIFAGWYTSSSNGDMIITPTGKMTTYTVDGYYVNGLWDISNDVILYAQYIEATPSYVLTYNCQENGGKVYGSSNTYSSNYMVGSIVDLDITCTKSGYEFVGWNTDKNAINKLDSYTMPNNSQTLYGIYKKNSKTLRANFNANGATLSSGEAKTCIIDEVYNKEIQKTTCEITTPVITREGYTIIGWNTNSNDTTNNSAYDISTNKLTLNISDDINEGRTWYPISKPNRYKITFNYLDGNLNGSSELYIEYNSDKIYENKDSNELGTVPTVNKEGFIFTGWYTPTDTIIINSDGSITNTNVNNYLSSGKWIINQDIVLYAHFEKENEEPTEEIFEFINQEGYDINDDVLYQIIPGMNSETLFNTINTNGVLSLIDKENNIHTESMRLRTGYKLRATFTTKVLEYKLSVKGDVLGTGEPSRENAKEIAKHIIKKNVIKEKEYLLASDYDNDGKIKMNDVIKMLRDKRNKENF